MAFPIWSNKRNNSSTQDLSPRQIANKAYQLAIKKLDKDDKRKKPHYSVRERLLLSHTMIKAEELLHKKIDSHRRIIADDDDMMPPFKKMEVTPPKPLIKAPVEEPQSNLTASLITAVTNYSLQSSSFVSHDFCRSIMIPSHTLTPIL